MAIRVEFKFKNGDVKNLDKPLALRLQGRKQGKIVSDSLTVEQQLAADQEVVKQKEAALDKREKALDAREKKIEKESEKLNKK